jgi:hypothetical protein
VVFARQATIRHTEDGGMLWSGTRPRFDESEPVKQAIQGASTFHRRFFRRVIPQKIAVYSHSSSGQHSRLDKFLARFLELGYSFAGPEAFVSSTGRLIFLPENIYRLPWFFEYAFQYNLDNACVNGRVFERLTARSAVGGSFG